MTSKRNVDVNVNVNFNVNLRSVIYFDPYPHPRYNTEEYNTQVEVFVCVEVLRPSQPNGVMSSAVSLPNHTFTGQA